MSKSDMFLMKQIPGPGTEDRLRLEILNHQHESEDSEYLEDFVDDLDEEQITRQRQAQVIDGDSDFNNSDLDIGGDCSGDSAGSDGGGFDELFKRQLSYPPLPRYDTPVPFSPNPFDKIGLLTPMEEVTEPPSTTGTRTPNSRPMTGRLSRSQSRSQSRAQSAKIHPGSASRRLSLNNDLINETPSPIQRISSSKREPVVTFNPQNDIINIPPNDPEDTDQVSDIHVIEEEKAQTTQDNKNEISVDVLQHQDPQNQANQEEQDFKISASQISPNSSESSGDSGSIKQDQDSENPDQDQNHQGSQGGKNHTNSDEILSEEAKDIKLRKERRKKRKTLEELEEQIRKIESAGLKRTAAAAGNTRSKSKNKSGIGSSIVGNTSIISIRKTDLKRNAEIDDLENLSQDHEYSDPVVLPPKGFYKETRDRENLDMTIEGGSAASGEISTSSAYSEEDASSSFLQLNEDVEIRKIEVNLGSGSRTLDVVIPPSNYSETSSESPVAIGIAEKMNSYEKIRSWQCSDGGGATTIGGGNNQQSKYSAAGDSEFANALDGMITQLHGTKVNWEHRIKLAEDLTASLKNVSPQTLLKYICQIIPLVTSIASESHFRVSLSILNTILVLGDRLRDCRTFLGGRPFVNADLTWLIRRLCNICGESRSTLRTEGALALSHLVKGAGPDLVCEPLYSILASESKGNSELNAGPRIKAAALDALTFALLTFPRDDFDLPTLAKHGCKSLWNTKRRVRQASLECLAVVAHAISPSVALPLFRKFIEETKLDQSISGQGSNSNLNTLNLNGSPVKQKSQLSVANPYSAVAARVSRHLLPSPSPAGLVEYAVSINQRGLERDSSMDSSIPAKSSSITKNTILEPVLNGKTRFGSSNSSPGAADIAYVLAGTGPIANTPFCSPNSQAQTSPREWLSEQTLGGVLDSDPARISGDRRLTGGACNSGPGRINGYNYNIQDQLQNQVKGNWSNVPGAINAPYATANTVGGYNSSMQRRDVKPVTEKVGFSLLPNKYSNGGENHHHHPQNHGLYHQHHQNSDLNSNTLSNSSIGHYKNNYSSPSPPPLVYPTHGNGNGHHHGQGVQQYIDYHLIGQQTQSGSGSGGKKYMESRQTDSDNSSSKYPHDETDHLRERNYRHTNIFGSTDSIGHHRNGRGDYINKVKQNYEVYGVRIEENEKNRGGDGNNGMDSAGSSSISTRDSGVSSLKSGKTIPSPPELLDHHGHHSSASGVRKDSQSQSKSRSTSRLRHRSNSKSKSPTVSMPLIEPPYGFGDSVQIQNNWAVGSSPEIPSNGYNDDRTDEEIDHRRSNGIRGQPPPSNGFLHRKSPAVGSGLVKKSSSTDFHLSQKLSGLKLQDIDSSELDVQDDHVNYNDHGHQQHRSLSQSSSSLEKESSPSHLYNPRSQNNNNHKNQSNHYSNNSTTNSSGGGKGKIFPTSLSMDSIDVNEEFLDNNNTSKKPPSSKALGQRQSPYRSQSRNPSRSRNINYSSKNTSSAEDCGSPTSPEIPTQPGKTNGVGLKKLPTKIYKGSFLEANSRGSQNEVYPQDMKPVENPRQSLAISLSHISSKDWDQILEGFKILVRLIRHHPEVVRNDLHNVNMQTIVHILSLRSQVVKYACGFFRELFIGMGKAMEPDVEKIIERLLDKTADTNKFIKEDATAVLDVIVMNISPQKVIQCLDNYGSKHRNQIVRGSAARLIGVIVTRHGPERSLYELPDKLLPMLVRFVQEGSLETRTHAKACLVELMRQRDFDLQLRRYVTAENIRNASKALSSIKNEVRMNL